MSWFGKLFGTDEALKNTSETVKDVSNGIMSGIDKAFYTDQEKATFQMKVLLSLQDQFTPRAISRRILAFIFGSIYWITFLIALIYSCLDKQQVVDNIIKLAKSFDMGPIIITIVIFYFGNYMIDKFMRKKDD